MNYVVSMRIEWDGVENQQNLVQSGHPEGIMDAIQTWWDWVGNPVASSKFPGSRIDRIVGKSSANLEG
jgi:hypothetical protein